MNFKLFSIFLILILTIGFSFAALSSIVKTTDSNIVKMDTNISIIKDTADSNKPALQLDTTKTITQVDDNAINFILKEKSLGFVSSSSLYVFDSNNYYLYNTIDFGNASATAYDITPDGKYLYVATLETKLVDTGYGSDYVEFPKLLKIDIKTNKMLEQYDLIEGTTVRYLRIAPDNRIYVSWEQSYSQKPGMTVLDFKNDKKWEWLWKDYFSVDNAILSIQFNKDGSIVYFATPDYYGNVFRLDWVENKFKEIFFSDVESSGIRKMAMKIDSEAGCTIQFSIDTIFCFDSQKTIIPITPNFTPRDLRFSKDGEKFYTVGFDSENSYLAIYSGLSKVALTDIYSYNSPQVFNLNEPDYRADLIDVKEDKIAYIAMVSRKLCSSWVCDKIIAIDLSNGNKLGEIQDLVIDRFSDVRIAPKMELDYNLIGKLDLKNEFKDAVNVFDIKYNYPGYSSTNVPINGKIAIEFNRDVDTKTLTSDNLYLLNSHNFVVKGKITYNNKIAIFVPESNLLKNATYTVFVLKKIKDTKGNVLLKDYNWKFKTGDFVNAPAIQDNNNENKTVTINLKSNLTLNILPVIPLLDSNDDSNNLDLNDSNNVDQNIVDQNIVDANTIDNNKNTGNNSNSLGSGSSSNGSATIGVDSNSKSINPEITADSNSKNNLTITETKNKDDINHFGKQDTNIPVTNNNEESGFFTKIFIAIGNFFKWIFRIN